MSAINRLNAFMLFALAGLLFFGQLAPLSAATVTGKFKIVTYYQNSPTTKQPLSGVKVRVVPNSDGADWRCNTAVKYTNSNGVAIFTCETKKADGGRLYDIKGLTKSGYTLITPVKSSYRLPANKTTVLTFNFSKDSDGDGILDSSDNCPSTKGTAAYKGCKPPPNPPPKKCPSGYTGTPPNCKKKPPASPSPAPSKPSPPPSYSSTRSVAQPPSVGDSTGSAPDRQPPSKPGDLSAAQADPSSVTLFWTASTDNIGVTSYSVQRSIDKKVWTTEEVAAEESSYEDHSISFNTQYYYRVFAQDAAGNTSDAGTAEIKTMPFESNAQPDQEAVITSEDQVVTATIPAGALTEPALCNIIMEEGFNDLLPTSPEGPSLLFGPYALECKFSSSELVEEFAGDVRFDISFDSEKVNSATLYNFEIEEWVARNDEYSTSQPNFSFASRHAQPFAVLGDPADEGGGKGGLVTGIFVSLLLLGASAYAIRRWLRARNSQAYESDGSLNIDFGPEVPPGYSPGSPSSGVPEPHQTASKLPGDLATQQHAPKTKEDDSLSPLQRAEKKLKEMQ